MRKTTKYQGRRKAMKGRRQARRRVARLANSEFASAKQTLLLLNDNVNLVYKLDQLALSQFDRLSTIAEGYQFYRITKVEMKFKPFADTFTNSGTNSLPYFLWLMDRNENFQIGSTDFSSLRDGGAKPIRFDDKTITVRWKPNVLYTMPNDAANPPNPTAPAYAASRVSPWLPTNRYAAQEVMVGEWAPSQVPHRGIYYGVQSDLATTAWQYGSEITIHVQFKKPSVKIQVGEGAVPAQSKLVVAKENPVSV